MVALSVPSSVNAAQQGSDPSTWKTWHLTGPDQFRLSAPPAPDSRRTHRELKELERLQNHRTKHQRRVIRRWNQTPAPVPWTNVILDQLDDYQSLRPSFATRDLAVLHTGLYDAMVAASDSRVAYSGSTRPAPEVLDPSLRPLLRSPTSSYAPVQAVMAGTAERLLTYLNPEVSPSTFERLADDAVNSRLWAGVAYRSDVERGRELGHEVAQAVIDHVSSDNSNSTQLSEGRPQPGEDRAQASGDGDVTKQWQPTPSAFEQAIGARVGTWRPWLLSAPDQLVSLLPGPYAYGSQQFMDELHQVIDVQANLTDAERSQAFFWDDSPGSYTPAGHWFSIALGLINDYKLNTAEATRALALLGATEVDAVISFFRAKYHWWSIRPVTAIWRLCYDTGTERLCTDQEAQSLHEQDPSLAPYWGTWYPLIETPPFPSYPGGHGTFSGAAGKVLSYLVPEAGDTLNQLAEAAANSRLYGGIHYDSDNQDGLLLGRAVADEAIQYGESDGSGL
jgi:membrane-associated phospholipid phosphatase